MLKRSELERAQARAAAMLAEAGIALSGEERKRIEVVELGLGELEKTGLEIVVYVNSDRYCAKELVMFPRQTCPEHRHPRVGDDPGKTETFRVRTGVVWLHVPGEPTKDPKARAPEGSEQYYTALHEIELAPGEQYTVTSDTLHWFQAGDEGAIVSEFSSPSRDESDVFTDPRIERATKVVDG